MKFHSRICSICYDRRGGRGGFLSQNPCLQFFQFRRDRPPGLLAGYVVKIHLAVLQLVLFPWALRQQQFTRGFQLVRLLPQRLFRHAVVVIRSAIGRLVLRPVGLLLRRGHRRGGLVAVVVDGRRWRYSRYCYLGRCGGCNVREKREQVIV